MSESAPKEYEYVEFSFKKPSGFRNGKYYDVTAFLLVPAEVVPEMKQAQEKEVNESLYKTLLSKGALLHKEDGPAYKVIEKSGFNKHYAVLLKEEYWVKGVRQKGNAHVKNLGKFKF